MPQNTQIPARLIWIAAAAILTTVAAGRLTAQEPVPSRVGTLTGHVLEAKTGQPLSEAGVQLVGTTRGAQTGIDGRFRFANLPTGTYTIQVRRVGYQPKAITGLYLDADKATDQPIVLERANVTLAAVVA